MITSRLRYAGAAGVIAADRCPHTRQAGISDKSRVLIVLVGAGGAIPTTDAATTCAYGADAWQSKARNLGFDVYVVTYQDPAALTQRQAFGVIELIQRLQAEGRITPAADVAMVGLSWGGLIARYALQYMETHGPAHNVDLWVAGDSPLQGAYVPIGVQHVGNYFGTDLGVKPAASSMAAMLDTPSTRQLLIYHYTRTGQSGPSWTPEYAALFTTELRDALGGFPRAAGLRRVGVSDGRADGKTDAPAPGAQIVGWGSGNFDVVGRVAEVTKTFDTTTVKISASSGKWFIHVKTTTTILGAVITLFDHTYVWAITARVDVRANALAARTSGTVFEARPTFTLDGKRVDLLNVESVFNLIKPLVRAEIPAIARGVWDLVADQALGPVAAAVAAGAKTQIDKTPALKFRNFSVNAPYAYDGGPGGRSDKGGVVADLMSASGVGTVSTTLVRNHSFIPINSALMLENTLGIPFDPASVAAGLGQAPRTPFDRIVYATTNLGHLDAARSLVFPTAVTELTELVQRGG